MRTTLRIASAAFALATAVSGVVPASAATYSPFARYFDDQPDFVVEQAYQYENSDTYLVRVCNRGDTPVSWGTLRVAVGRSVSDRQERNFSGITPAAGTCNNVELTNVRQYGRKENRTYGLIASVSWNGSNPESSLTNNSKNITAAPTMKSGGNVSNSWTSANTRTTYQDPVSDLYLDRNGTSRYAGRTWYYSNGSNNSRCRGYWDVSGNWRSYETHAIDSSCYYDPYSRNSDGYYWYSTPSTGGTYYDSSNSGTPNSNYRWDSTTGTYRSDSYFDYTGTSRTDYYEYPYYRYVESSTNYANTTPNFYVSRFERDGSSRNVLATVCNNGNDMAAAKDITVAFRDLSREYSYKVSPYIRLRSGECRDVSVSFASFLRDYTGYRTFEVTVDPTNAIYENNENDNVARANIWIEK